jgi:hypothetical protein
MMGAMMMRDTQGSAQLLRPVPDPADPRPSDAKWWNDHDSEVFRLEQEILAIVAAGQRALLARAARLVRERLAPVDVRAARVLLGEIRRGALP